MKLIFHVNVNKKEKKTGPVGVAETSIVFLGLTIILLC